MSKARGNGRKSTGPMTPNGKNNSSRNSTKHGCTSKALLLPDESEAEWAELLERWMADYRPDSPTFVDQVKRAAQAEWFLLRNTRRYNQAEQKSYEKNADPVYWSEEEHHLLEVFGRYRTTAQRWFHRERQAAEQLRKSRVMAEWRAKEAAEKTRGGGTREVGRRGPSETKAGLNVEAHAREEVPAVIQHVEVWVDADGRTITKKIPPDGEVRRMAEGRTPPVIVRRPVYFRGVIPGEYRWITKNPEAVQPGARFYITMPYEEWQAVVEREERNGDGHICGELAE